MFRVALRAREGLLNRGDYEFKQDSPGEQFVGLLDGASLVNALVLTQAVGAGEAREFTDRFFPRGLGTRSGALASAMYAGVQRVCGGLVRACEIGVVEPE